MWRVTTRFSGAQVTGGGINQLYFDAGGAASDAFNASKVFWTAASLLIHTSTTFTVDGEIELVDASTGLITSVVTVTSFTGTAGASGDPLPMATQGLVRLRTGTFVAGRELRGRIFIPAAIETHNTDGAPNSTYLTALSTAAAALVSDANSALQVYSRTHHVAATVSATSAWSKWSELRSRRD